jgi:hypothetical protein
MANEFIHYVGNIQRIENTLAIPPYGLIDITKNGTELLATPTKPFISINDVFYQSPKEWDSRLENPWKDFCRGIQILTNPHTPSAHLDGCVDYAGTLAFINALKIHDILPEAHIILPLQVAFGPDYTTAEKIEPENTGFSFLYNSFLPPKDPENTISFDYFHTRIERIYFRLSLTPHHKTYVYRLGYVVNQKS